MAVPTSRFENIAVVTIHRPQHRNAVDHATAQQLANELTQ
jgi:enoyl-CoA hydratase/carnithine racemase